MKKYILLINKSWINDDERDDSYRTYRTIYAENYKIAEEIMWKILKNEYKCSFDFPRYPGFNPQISKTKLIQISAYKEFDVGLRIQTAYREYQESLPKSTAEIIIQYAEKDERKIYEKLKKKYE